MFLLQKFLNKVYLKYKFKKVITEYDNLKRTSQYSQAKNKKRQLHQLNQLLKHAYKYNPYYRKLITDHNLVENNQVKLTDISELQAFPFLTKAVIRKEKEKLFSIDHNIRKSYKETSGGSTGEPVELLQDKIYGLKNTANFFLAQSWRGAKPFDSIVYIWGAERDTFEGKKPLTNYIKDFFRNRITLNSFKMTNKDIESYIKILNKHKPKIIIAYVQSIYQIAKFARENNLHVEKQNAIHAAAGTVYDFMRNEIESVFQCKIYNHYGSREVGAIASECRYHNGLHIMMEHTLVEIIDKNGEPCLPGKEGEIVVTSLNNYSMPLIRYKIGDIGILQEYANCECGCSYPKKLKKVVGRTTDIFKTNSGSLVMPEYFIHLIGVVCNRGNIKTFQVIQKKLDKIIVKIVTAGEILESDLDEIEEKIKIVMGRDCTVIFKFVSNISKTNTGKYLYTISEL